MVHAIVILYSHRRTLWATTLNDIRARYIGTTFGLIWTILYPLLFLGLYSVVYTTIFRIQLGKYSDFDYVLLIFAGLVPFLGFTEALSLGSAAVISSKGLVKNTLFPIDLIPVKAVLVGSVTMLVGLIMLQASLWIRGIFFITQFLVPLILVLQIIFTIGLIWLLSALTVFFPDFVYMIPIINLFLMLVSPIAYTEDMIPASLVPFLYPNPLFYLIMLYRDTMVIGTVPLNYLIAFVIITIIFFALGYYIFSRLKVVFADYV